MTELTFYSNVKVCCLFHILNGIIIGVIVKLCIELKKSKIVTEYFMPCSNNLYIIEHINYRIVLIQTKEWERKYPI